MKQIKWIALMLVLVLAVVGLLAGCGKKKDTAQGGQPQQTVEQTDKDDNDLQADTDDSSGDIQADDESDYSDDDADDPDEDAAVSQSDSNSGKQSAGKSGSQNNGKTSGKSSGSIKKNGSYTTKEDVALYLNTYGKLPSNFITKKQARKLGWSGGSLEPYAPGKCIGGDEFANYEGVLPEDFGRTYYECDIDTLGAKKRGAKRIVFSDDGLIYYTDDHYESFTLLYGQEG